MGIRQQDWAGPKAKSNTRAITHTYCTHFQMLRYGHGHAGMSQLATSTDRHPSADDTRYGIEIAKIQFRADGILSRALWPVHLMTDYNCNRICSTTCAVD